VVTKSTFRADVGRIGREPLVGVDERLIEDDGK
jgi:hypothetical protein